MHLSEVRIVLADRTGHLVQQIRLVLWQSIMVQEFLVSINNNMQF